MRRLGSKCRNCHNTEIWPGLYCSVCGDRVRDRSPINPRTCESLHLVFHALRMNHCPFCGKKLVVEPLKVTKRTGTKCQNCRHIEVYPGRFCSQCKTVVRRGTEATSWMCMMLHNGLRYRHSWRFCPFCSKRIDRPR